MGSILTTLSIIILVFGPFAAPSKPVKPFTARIPILVYHHIDNQIGRWHVTPRKFEQQLIYLVAKGFHTLSMDTYLDALQNGTALPDKSIILTFDDGDSDAYDHAFPLLKKYGLSGTFFIVTGFVGKPAYVTWKQVAEMQAAGIEIGAHTVHHPFLSQIHPTRALYEILWSRVDLFLHLGKMPDIFAYPYNDRNAETIFLTRLAGFRGAAAVAGHKGDTRDNPFEIPRITIESGEGVRTFALVTSKNIP